MSAIEYRASPVLLDAPAPGRRLQGVCLRYGDTARIGDVTERFAPGALVAGDNLLLNLEHDELRALTERGALTVQDTGDAVTMEARILDAPIGDRALEAVKSGRMAGLSIEFRAERETVQDGVRIVERALLTGIGLVAHPAYSTSVEARNRATDARWRYYR